jgi:Ring finger domain
MSSDLRVRLAWGCLLTTVLVCSAVCSLYRFACDYHNQACPLVLAVFAFAFHSMVLTSLWKTLPLLEWIKALSWNQSVILDNAVYSHDMKVDSVCYICLEDFVCEERLSKGHLCRHWFHTDCLEQWRNRGSHTCPYCRQSLSHCTVSCK